MKVKICGITNVEDAMMAYEAGADIIGFVFDQKSPRHADYEVLRQASRAGLTISAVYTDISSIYSSEMMEDYVQIHFPHDDSLIDYVHERGGRVISVIRYGLEDLSKIYADYKKADIIMVERKPKISEVIDSDDFDGKKLGFAGGIDQNDVHMILRRNPLLIDVSSSLEYAPGRKDRHKIMDFFEALGEYYEDHR
ncbi:phosphoribosylanthranilate isomerase [Thermoplasma sp. Kam2015]|uniref:phosphoribosylanthranilate isomerase n=1 Tax=Thermoplasma sp. Kam2015 TaxID=2094122 RepID=UPI000D8ABFBF|nr:phosphoribosylanthranilate isomerase [Thermoplasma sp. Kam2015]PYB68321.1 phosphoribosylanthranilate isomerase [Thermoplasma sp. Kam2015]